MVTSKPLLVRFRRLFLLWLESLRDVESFAVIIGEIANFVAYIFAPAVMVTPLGALSIIVR